MGALNGIGFFRTMVPVSSRDFRLEMTIGQATDTNSHEEPVVHWFSQRTPNQYFFMSSASVSADHSFSGVVRMYVT